MLQSNFVSMLIFISPLLGPAEAATLVLPRIQDTVAVTPEALPVVNSAQEMKGKTLIEALRGGGYVLYMRHALQVPPRTTGCEQKNLTAVGEEQARKVGAAIRDLRIPIGVVRSSEPCRNLDTARLLGFGNFEVTEALNPGGMREGFDVHAARFKQLIETPPSGTNMLLVSHVHGSANKAEWMHLEIAEIIVYRPDGQGATTPVARVRAEEWTELLRVAAETAAK